ncbi:MAG: HNH endonuclease signature motif containing protein [bacterium]|nr:HNH endonuclease signature motif containing protein [bacterium]
MSRKRTWTINQLKEAVRTSLSYRQVLSKLNLRPTGGNYDQLKKYIKEENFDIEHFTGQVWNKGRQGYFQPHISIEKILVKNSTYQSFKLKKRLFGLGIKLKACEECGWCQIRHDGSLPLELDHINGDRHDNRLENLRILCPNCHSLKPTHRGKNRSKNTKKVFI